MLGAMLIVKGPINDVLLIEMPKLLTGVLDLGMCVCAAQIFPHASRNASWW